MPTPRRPFFHQATTHKAIVDIAETRDLVVYVGAGYSLDRTGLGWAAIVRALLEFNGSSTRLNQYLVETSGPLAAASIAESAYRAIADPSHSEDDTHRKISDRLRSVLYSPLAWQRGELGGALADFAYTWTDYGASAESRRIAFITTNYDDYLFTDLCAGHERAVRVSAGDDDRRIDEPAVVFPSTLDPLVSPNAELSDWAKGEEEFLAESEIRCAYLHGRIPVAASNDERYPVVSERDYALTRHISEAALTAAFANADVVMVGVSLTDPPLLQALRNTADAGRKRWALMLGPDEEHLPSGVSYSGVVRGLRARIQDLGVQPLFLDYPVQFAQFFHELGLAANLPHPSGYRGGKRYGQRLVAWSAEWEKRTEDVGFRERQADAHALLAALVPALRDELDASEDEHLKVEVWLRRQPSDRQLQLWATSTGTWSDSDTMRKEHVGESKLVCAQAFRFGQPQWESLPDSRWRNMIAAPIWARGRKYEATMMLGVAAVASTAEPEESSLVPSRNASRILRTLEMVQAAGLAIADVEPDEVRDLFPQLVPGAAGTSAGSNEVDETEI